MVSSRDVDWRDIDRSLHYARVGASNAVKNRARGTTRECEMRVCRAFFTREPEVTPIGLLEEGEIGDAVGARQSTRGRCFNGVKGKVTVTDEAPGMGGGSVAEWGYHAPKLLGGGLRATGVPRGIRSDDSQDEATCRGGGNGNIKYNSATSETIWSWYPFTVQVMPDRSDDTPF